MKRIFVFLLFLFNAGFAFGYITENLVGECDTGYSAIHAVFQINEYTCNSGYFLPADTLGCQPCPSDATCSGGTFKYSESQFQGIVPATPFTQNQTNLCSARYSGISAKFQVNQYTCAAGYYLPAGNDWVTDNDGCTICPENSYCPGGTYTFNETTAQGITACAAGTYSPEGMWEVAQCGRIFHVGDDVIYLRSVRKTVHALNFDMDMDGVADYFANMTPLNVPMHINSEHGLKILLDGIEYSVYDDTVDVSLYEQ